MLESGMSKHKSKKTRFIDDAVGIELIGGGLREVAVVFLGRLAFYAPCPPR
jgi:hypothetical protein